MQPQITTVSVVQGVGPPPSTFGYAAAAVHGREHLKPLAWMNCQDAFALAMPYGCFVASVSDGCSSAPRSESGAQRLARFFVSAVTSTLPSFLGECAKGTAFASYPYWSRVQSIIEGKIRQDAENCLLPGEPLDRVLRDVYSATLIGAIVTPFGTFIGAAGDGFFAINGKQSWLEASDKNAPRYPVYRLMSPTVALAEGMTRFSDEECALREVAAVPTGDIETLAIGTDGLRYFPQAPVEGGPRVEDVWDEGIFKNPDNLRRLFAKHNNRPNEADRIFKDDVCAVALRRVQPANPGGSTE